MPSFGENLRREREKRKITLDQISQSTKIGTRMLQALEEDKFSQLPGGIFNKGFVRAYARTVGLDEEQTISDYLQASGEAPPALPEIAPEHSAPRIEASAETSRRSLPWGIFAALLLLAALALSLWSHRQNKERAASLPSPVVSQTVSPNPVTPRPALQSGPSAAPLPAATATANPPATGASSQPVPDGSVALPESVSAPAARQAGTGFAVNIQAHEDSWTLITADGRTVFTGLMAAGDQHSVRAQKEIVIRAGNAGGVDVFFNGKKVPPIGQYGEIKTVTFGPEGVASNHAPPPTAP